MHTSDVFIELTSLVDDWEGLDVGFLVGFTEGWVVVGFAVVGLAVVGY